MRLFSKDNKVKTKEQRKHESMVFLKSHGIEPMKELPFIEDGEKITLRSKEEVVKRAIGLLLISLYAEGLCTGEPRDNHRSWIETLIRQYSARNFFTPKEKTFLENNQPPQAESIHFSWQYEPLAVLLWSLGFLDMKDALSVPAEICDVPKVVNSVKVFQSYNKLYSHAVLRGREIILDQADLIYRYDWVCVEDRIHNPEKHKMEWGIVMGRHKALNWLINYGLDVPQDWDNVSTDT